MSVRRKRFSFVCMCPCLVNTAFLARYFVSIGMPLASFGVPCGVLTLGVPWRAFGFDTRPGPDQQRVMLALCRGEFGSAEREAAGGVWSCHVDPGDAVVDFHRSECFGELTLVQDDGCGVAKL